MTRTEEWTDRYRAWEEYCRDEEKESPKVKRAACACSGLDRSSERAWFELPEDEKLKSCQVLCGRGHGLLREGQHARASRLFRKSLTCAEYAFPEEGEDSEALDSCRASSLEGLAECEFHSKRYLQVVEACTQALQIDRNSRVLLRRAMAFRLLDRYSEARLDLEDLPHDDARRSESRKLQERIDAYERRSKEQSQRMFHASTERTKDDDDLLCCDEFAARRRGKKDQKENLVLDDLYEPLDAFHRPLC